MTDFEYDEDLRRSARSLHPAAEDEARLAARVAQTLARPRRSPLPPLVAAAAALALAVWAWAPRGPVVRPVVTGDLAAGVVATSDGRGEATVNGARTAIAWAEGRLALEVTPAPGRQVEVRTAEAAVRVVGTGLTVERGSFGTTVSVSHGVVAVTCRDVPGEERIAAGQRTECFAPSGGLGKVLWLEAQRAPVAERLWTIERALAHPVELAETRRALVSRRVDALVELGRVEDAVAAARALPDPVARWTEGAQIAMGAGCAAAAPWLAALAGANDATGTLLLVQCRAEADQDGARAALAAADGAGWTPEQQAALAAWRAALR